MRAKFAFCLFCFFTDMDVTISDYKNSREIPDVLKPPEHTVYKILWCLGLPAILLMFLTIPDVHSPRWRKWYFFSFSMSLLWLMGTSYVLYWMIVVMGKSLCVALCVKGLQLSSFLPDTRNQFDMYSFVSQSWYAFWQKNDMLLKWSISKSTSEPKPQRKAYHLKDTALLCDF